MSADDTDPDPFPARVADPAAASPDLPSRRGVSSRVALQATIRTYPTHLRPF